MPDDRTGTENERGSGGETLIGGKPERAAESGGNAAVPNGDRPRMETTGADTPRATRGTPARLGIRPTW